MSPRPTRVLVVGATGGVGRHVVVQAIEAGYATRAVVRDPDRACQLLPPGVEVVVGDLTEPGSLAAAVDGVDAVVFTHGSAGARAAEAVDYGGVRNVLAALGDRPARIALMTAIGVTDRAGAYNRSTQAHDWKRRSERLVRVSGRPYTIVRPGWFDYNGPNEHHLELLQGDTRHAGDPSDGVIARAQIVQVLLAALTCDHAIGKTFELVAVAAAAQTDLDAVFAPLDPDTGIEASTTPRTCRWPANRSASGTTSARTYRKDPDVPRRTWLITGVSSGFGRELTSQLLARGDRVLGTVRRPDAIVDVLVSNAGYGLFGAAEELSDQQVQQILATNLRGPITLIRAALPHLRAQKRRPHSADLLLRRAGRLPRQLPLPRHQVGHRRVL